MNEWMNERKNKWMNEWVNEWMNEWTYEWMNESMNEWMNELLMILNISWGSWIDFILCKKKHLQFLAVVYD